MRLTEKDFQFRPEDIVKLSSIKTAGIYNKLRQLEDIEEELGVDLIPFLKEIIHLIKDSSQTTGYTTLGKKITADYGCVEDFLNQLKEVIK